MKQRRKEAAMRQWFTMQASSTQPDTAEIVIYDEIGKSWFNEDAVSAKGFLDALAELGDVSNINLRINSPGGDIMDGVAIYNAIKNHKARVTASVDGIAASAASYIAMAADRIVMPANTFMLIHGASGFVFGNADDMRSMAGDLDRVDKSITATYVSRSKSTSAKIKAIMKEDRLMDAAEAKELGLADEVTKETKIAASFSLRLLPQAAAERLRAETGAEQGDPPPTAPEPERPAELLPPVPPVSPPPMQPTAQPTAEVIDLKKEGIEEHKAYVSQVTDLCTLANHPERVGGYVRAGTPADEVRKDLLEIRATVDVMPQHPLVPKPSPTKAWESITDKINARRKK
jgi:ATP-dependent Clp protease protease subunit